MSKRADKHPDKVKVSGVILIDKSGGLTSQQVVSKVKYLFKSPKHDSKKAGHTGTLDPMATGLLPVCLGEATKFSHYQLDADKSYQATIRLGQQTDTGDAEGQIISQAAVPAFDTARLNEVAQRFLGAQQQIPPMYSALKKDGKKLYEYARAGIEIERAPRDIVIQAIDLIAIDAQHIQLTVTCSKGTYVRVLAEDIAKALGTCGHLTALRRLTVGDFKVADALTLEQLEALKLDNRLKQLLPVDACVSIDPELTLSVEQVVRVRQGQRLNVADQLTEDLRAYVLDSIEKNTLKKNYADRRTGDKDRIAPKDSTDNKERIRPGDASNSNHQANLEQASVYETPIDIRLVDEQGQFIGLGAVSLNGRLQPKKLIQL